MGFRWQDYAEVKGVDYLRSDGTPYALATPDFIAYADKTKSLVEKTMDQMSAIPEFQQLLLRSAETGPMRLLAAGDVDRISDPRLAIKIDPGHDLRYNADTHTITLGLRGLAQINHGDPPRPFSLQRILFHETGHGADETLSDAHELGIHKKIFEESLEKTLTRFPDQRVELQKSGTLFGHDIGSIRNAPDTGSFVTAYENIFDGNLMKYKLESFDDVSNQRLMMMDEKTRAQAFLNSTFQPALKDAVTKEDEMPIIAQENAVMAKYYGEAPRIGYEASYGMNVGKFEDLALNPNYQGLSDSLSTRIHPSILPSSGIKDAPVINDVSYELLERKTPTPPAGMNIPSAQPAPL